ncbi:MAG: hypothetical protein JJE36_00825 [Coriobacteriia bacterium]|nr:hypothetical protein [Coriobacteriia bacterium]
MTISWPAVSSAHVYVIYRADDATGKNAQRVGETEDTNFKDIFLELGSNHSYAIQSGATRDGIDTVDTSTLHWSSVQQVPSIVNEGVSPHKIADGNAQTCQKCHLAYGANNDKFIVTSGAQTQKNQAVAVCLDCHAKGSAAERTFTKSVLSGSKSGHVVNSASTEDGKLECTMCHDPHNNSSTDSALQPSTIKKFGNLTAGIVVDTNKANARCVACHDDDDTWVTAFGKTYPSTSNPTLVTEATTTGYAGYPKAGTYPGSTVANSTTKNVHANISASNGYDKGDCRYCHSSHGSTSPYSGLLSDRGELRAMISMEGTVTQEEKTSGAYASFCLSCHNGSNSGQPWSAAANIADTVSLPLGSTEASRTAFLQSNAGHKVTAAGATIPQNSAIPCYECHNAHGSSTNDHNFADTRGVNLMDKNGKNDICFTCHLTSSGTACVDGATKYVLYADLPASKQTILGLDRNDTTNGMKLPILPDNNLGHSEDSTQTCSACHGSAHDPVASGEYTSAAASSPVVQGSTEATLSVPSASTLHLISTYSTKISPSLGPLDIAPGL